MVWRWGHLYCWAQLPAVVLLMASPQNIPTASIVVVSFNALTLLERCLASLVDQAEACGAEIVVVRAGRPDESPEMLRQRFPRCRWLVARSEETIPRMRSAGVLACRGRIVALVEDDCVADGAWCEALLEAHRGQWAAVGGAVEPGGYARSIDWAVYFYEYSRFMLPFEAHAATDLPVNNVSYKRDAIAGRVHEDDDGLYDVFTQEQLRQRGLSTLITPTLVVQNANSWSLSHILLAPYHHGRGFGAKRMGNRPLWWRVLLAVLAPFLPALQVYRILQITTGRKRLRGRMILALPAIVLFGSSWAFGECLGYLRGPGQSVQRWR